MKKWSPPEWLKSIPKGSHGSTDPQKRLWKITSDVVRILDWHKRGGYCVSCGVKIPSWKEGQAGHFKPYSVCNSYFKFNLMNLALQCAYDNAYGGADKGKRFGDELERRGVSLKSLEKENLKLHGQKMYDYEIVAMIEDLLDLQLPEYPEYFNKVNAKRHAMSSM